MAEVANLRLDVKHLKEGAFKAKAIDSDLFREVKKVKRQKKKKNSETFFFEKEINEIKAQIPEVQLY